TAAAVLEEGGHIVEIIDCAVGNVTRKALLEKISSGGYDLAGWAAGTPSIRDDLALAGEIREISSSIHTAVFGTHVTALADECLRASPGLDFIIRNEPEATILALVDCIERGESLKSVEGISYRDDSGVIVHNPDRDFIEDLDRLPVPAWHLVDLDCYRLPIIGRRYVILLPVRGCPWPCTFCTSGTYYGKRLRRRSVPVMMDEIGHIVERFGITDFFIWADTFTADRDYVLDFCREIRERNYDIKWTCNSRVDTVDVDMLDEMHRSGCWMISYGIESGNRQTLSDIKKGIDPEQSRRAVDLAGKAGIMTVGHFIMGFPGESLATLSETADFALSLKLDMAQFYCAVPFPGSSMYDEAREAGWIAGKGFDEFSQGSAVMELSGLAPSIVNRFRRKTFLRFYLRPRQMMTVAKLVRRGGVKSLVRSGIRFAGWCLRK
ncbi:MAG: radical SAM protein, partial [Syntrophales bacterium]|nr:radical SAM protein [Syntrophales bacterium]